MKMEMDKLVTVTMTDDGVSEQAVRNIQNYLYCGTLSPPALPSSFSWVWKNERGTLPKRIASALYETNKFKLSEQDLSTIGTMASVGLTKVKEYYVDFTSSIGWKAGDFGDGGSCFWGDRKRAKIIIEKNGFAMRFWVDDKGSKGLGRVWGADITKQLGLDAPAFALFNAYGIDLALTGRVLGRHLGLSQSVVSLVNKGMGTDGILFFNNSGLSVLVTDDITIGKVTAAGKRVIDLDWPDDSVQCHSCSVRIKHGGECRGNDEHYYCLSCWSMLFYSCTGCSKVRVIKLGFSQETWNGWERILGRPNKNTYCKECAEVYLLPCSLCGQNTFQGRLHVVENKGLCPDCFSIEAVRCGVCETVSLKTQKTGGVYLCVRCRDTIQPAVEPPVRTIEWIER